MPHCYHLGILRATLFAGTATSWSIKNPKLHPTSVVDLPLVENNSLMKPIFLVEAQDWTLVFLAPTIDALLLILMKTHLPQVTSLLRCFDHHFEEDPTEASHGLKPSAQLEKTQVESATLRVGGYCLAVPLHLDKPAFWTENFQLEFDDWTYGGFHK